ncbi:MAG: hypothetical protein HFJ28_06580 [Clostridia bacterium]|nr:hypothetical protein [Clostridia bacterium]
MRISVREIEVAMKHLGGLEVYGAENGGPTYQVERGQIKPECHFRAKVVNKKDAVFLKQAQKALKELGERKWPVKDDFEPYGDGLVQSVRGLVALVLVIQNRFSEELLNEMVNEIYQDVLSAPWISQNLSQMFTQVAEYDEKVQELATLLQELTRMVNPFANPNIKLKQPIEYLDRIAINVNGPNQFGCADFEIWTTAGFIAMHFWTNRISITAKCSENPMDKDADEIEIGYDIEFGYGARTSSQVKEDGIHYEAKVDDEIVECYIWKKSKRENRHFIEEKYYIDMLHTNWVEKEKVKKVVAYMETVLSRLQDSISAQLAEEITIGNRTYNLRFLTRS